MSRLHLLDLYKLLYFVSIFYPIHCYEPGKFSEAKESAVSKNRNSHSFWTGHLGEDHVLKLDSENFAQFASQESFIMFYASWCNASKEAADGFANVALEMAYTEGFTHVKFGALDCNGTLVNKYICNKKFLIIKYPRFIYFSNGTQKMYTVFCPRDQDYFYSWIVNKGDEKYCSKSGAGTVVYLRSFSTSSSPQTILNEYFLACVVILNLIRFFRFLVNKWHVSI